MEKQIVCGDRFAPAVLPDDTQVISPGFSLPMTTADDLAAELRTALDAPLDRPPLRELVKAGDKVTLAFDDPTVPCYAPVWATAIPMIVDDLRRAGVRDADISLVCANSLHRKFTQDELAKVLGDDVVREHGARMRCHDAEGPEDMVLLGQTDDGLHVQLSKAVTEADLTIYLNCSTMRGFSGGWKSICVGLSGYRSIHHHHTPDIMSMSLDRNQMHEMLTRMGAVVEERLGAERLFKIETVLASPVTVNTFFAGSVGRTRDAVVERLKAHQPPRRELVSEPVDIVVYGVPHWSPYSAFSHTNPILDIISTGLGYLGGMIQALGRPGCTVILSTPCPLRWNQRHHPSYSEVWETVLPETKDPDEARARFEPELAARSDYIDAYRFGNAFHPVHATMALYPLKRLRHASRVIVAGAEDPAVPQHIGFDYAPDVGAAIAMAKSDLGAGATVAFVENPMAYNRQ